MYFYYSDGLNIIEGKDFINLMLYERKSDCMHVLTSIFAIRHFMHHNFACSISQFILCDDCIKADLDLDIIILIYFLQYSPSKVITLTIDRT